MARMNTPEMELALLLQEANSRLQSEWRAKRYLAARNQRKIARTLGRNRRAMNGLGRVRMEVDTEVYHYYGQRYGYKCWKDEDFLRWHEQRHPELKVECRGTKEIQVGWTPADKRWTKKYEMRGTSNIQHSTPNPPHPNPLPQGGEGTGEMVTPNPPHPSHLPQGGEGIGRKAIAA